MNTYILLIIFSLVLLGSFFFNQIQRKYQISSVILLIISGIILEQIVKHAGINTNLPDYPLKVYGTLGLLIIVLEAVMDLEIHQKNRQDFTKAMFSAGLSVISSILIIGVIIAICFHKDIVTAVIYATPMAIVSSAIVIPSMASGDKSAAQEFLILESIFSDIIGVLIYNFLSTAEFTKWTSFIAFFLSIGVMLLISLVTTLFLAFPLSREKTRNLHVVILAFLILIYSLAKCFHLSALILILFFGLTLRNLPTIMGILPKRIKLENHLDQQIIQQNLRGMQEFIDDLGFIIRSIFFILLGYSIDLGQLLSFKVLLMGTIIIIAIYLVRFVITKYLFPSKTRLLATLVAPRGLITVLLFLQIPNQYKFPEFTKGITFFVVIGSSLVMTYGLIRNHRQKELEQSKT